MLRTPFVPTIAALALLALPASTARASGHLPIPSHLDCEVEETGALFGLIMPSDVGVFVPASSGPEFDLGWSWQIPITESCHGRLTGSVELIPGDASLVRGRFGYRYARRYFLVGFGGSFSGDGNTWSPELGVQFAHWKFDEPDLRFPDSEPRPNAAHLLVRTEFNSRFRGVTILLGWNAF